MRRRHRLDGHKTGFQGRAEGGVVGAVVGEFARG